MVQGQGLDNTIPASVSPSTPGTVARQAGDDDVKDGDDAVDDSHDDGADGVDDCHYAAACEVGC